MITQTRPSVDEALLTFPCRKWEGSRGTLGPRSLSLSLQYEQLTVAGGGVASGSFSGGALTT